MSTVKQLLRLHKQQKGKKTIANILGLSKNTAKSYLQKAEADELSLDALLNLEDPVLEARLHAGPPAYKDPRYEDLKSRLDYYAKELKRVGVTRQILYEEYKEGISKAYSYTQFCYHLKQYLKRINPSMVLTHKPADKLFLDFAGKKLHYIDRYTGELIACEVFIGCLPYSDYSFALAVPSQKVCDFIDALNSCLEAIGGVPQAIVPDNLKSEVITSSKYEPRLNRVLEDFANHYQTTIVPARARKPKDKALVENQVQLIYNRVYAKLRDQKFFDLESLNVALLAKVRQHNQTRRQLKDWCREEQFIAEEQSKLSSLPENSFEIKHYKTYKVADNNHIFLGEDKHYYSVPYQYIGQQVHVIYTKRLVRIHSQGKCIATHPRQRGKGQYTTAKAHLCF